MLGLAWASLRPCSDPPRAHSLSCLSSQTSGYQPIAITFGPSTSFRAANLAQQKDVFGDKENRQRLGGEKNSE
jgi:hypothetical protein